MGNRTLIGSLHVTLKTPRLMKRKDSCTSHCFTSGVKDRGLNPLFLYSAFRICSGVCVWGGGTLMVELLLTQDTRALCSWRREGLCSTRCTATWPWSAGSCNLRSCTADFFHALREKAKQTNPRWVKRWFGPGVRADSTHLHLPHNA